MYVCQGSAHYRVVWKIVTVFTCIVFIS